jgi:hypothetical protein
MGGTFIGHATQFLWSRSMSDTTATDALRRLWDSIRVHPADRKLCFQMADEQILDTEITTGSFVEDESYFDIRLSEMFIRDERVLMRTFVPLSVAIAEFIYNGKKQTMPFIMGNQLLGSIDPYVQGASVEFANTNIVGPIPYQGGNVALYVGLYRAEVNDLSRKLFSLVAGLVSTFDASGISKYLDIAIPLGTGLADLLGMKEVEFRLGKRDELSATGPNRFKPGYIAYINATAGEVDGELCVKNGMLYKKSNTGDLDRFSSADYCLIKIEQLSERGDYTTLPFHTMWSTAKDLIWQSQIEKAKLAFAQLVQQVAKSPELTKKHRFRLLQAYKANFEAEVAQSRYSASLDTPVEVMRSAFHDRRSAARGAIQLASAAAERASLLDAKIGLIELTKKWDSLPHLADQAKDMPLTDDILKSQLRVLESESAITKPDPEALATALTLATFGDTIVSRGQPAA